MGWKSAIAKPFAKQQRKALYRSIRNPIGVQEKVLADLLNIAKQTKFGQEHRFGKLSSHAEFKQAVPFHDYEGNKKYFDLVKSGQSDILWPGKPRYFAKTSGTTSGTKYIPITKESMPENVKAARHTLTNYIARTGKTKFTEGKMIFLQGSPELTKQSGIDTGRLSGIVHHHVPSYLLKNRLPSYKTNCIEDWESKLDAIIGETLNADMRLISGIPPWVQMYFERLLEKTGKLNIKALFPNFELFVHGGVNFSPYKSILNNLIGEEIDALETYPASEGFIAFQDDVEEKGLLLNINAGMFFEFIPVEKYHSENPPRLSLGEVELEKQYALLISSNAGLWAYDIGDTVKFVSKDPYRIKVTGRIKHFISAFGEHVIAEEVESAMRKACNNLNVQVKEFTVAPMIQVEEGLPYHQWFVEFQEEPSGIKELESAIDRLMCEMNIYYKDLVEGAVLQPLKISKVQKGGFNAFMKDRGKLGGQNKIPRLANTREFADQLQNYLVQ